MVLSEITRRAPIHLGGHYFCGGGVLLSEFYGSMLMLIHTTFGEISDFKASAGSTSVSIIFIPIMQVGSGVRQHFSALLMVF